MRYRRVCGYAGSNTTAILDSAIEGIHPDIAARQTVTPAGPEGAADA